MGLEKLAESVYFVSGIDTDAGKTIATGWLARELMRQGRRTVTLKFVQTGSENGSPDVAAHRNIMGCALLSEDLDGTTAPQVFTYPASPHLAARLDGKTLDLARIDACIDRLAGRFDTVLVEGAGGLMVPLTEELLTIDAVSSRQWPVVFVTGGKLGSINHTLLSFEALARRSMTLAAVVWNRKFDSADAVIAQDSFEYISAHLKRKWPKALLLECPVIDS